MSRHQTINIEPKVKDQTDHEKGRNKMSFGTNRPGAWLTNAPLSARTMNEKSTALFLHVTKRWTVQFGGGSSLFMEEELTVCKFVLYRPNKSGTALLDDEVCPIYH